MKTGHEQEATIVGFTEPRGSRKHFGSLVLGVYEKGKLVYAGHSGGGFSGEMLATLHARMMKLKPARSRSRAFRTKTRRRGSSRGSYAK
jgi:bifunctional non-homologous end joining protein LigD